MKNIQELINAKAKAIAEEKLNNFLKECINIGVNNIEGQITIKGEGAEPLWNAFTNFNSSFRKTVREKLVEKEIEVQSKLFYDKVNQLHSEVSNLLGDYIQQNNEQQF